MDFQVNGNPGDSCAILRDNGSTRILETVSDCSGVEHVAICQTICATATLCVSATEQGQNIPLGYHGDKFM